MIDRTTSALLPGFRAQVHLITHQPCLLPTVNDTDYVHGMVVFGQGSKGRNSIHEHYRPNARCVKVEAQIDVSVLASEQDSEGAVERWELRRRKVWALAWLWKDVGIAGCASNSSWTLEDYLEGRYDMDQDLRINTSEHTDEPGEYHRSVEDLADWHEPTKQGKMNSGKGFNDFGCAESPWSD